MNKQGQLKLIDGLWKVVGGIEYLKIVLADRNERRGATWNPIGGCFHRCQWNMPDGKLAECYAGGVATRLAQAHYPQGFEHHYFHPERLADPAKTKARLRIFGNSMSDWMGHWVSEEHVGRVIEAMNVAPHHVFLMLTKNPKRYPNFIKQYGSHIWLGASTPPDHMWGKELTVEQKARMFTNTLASFDKLPHYLVKWLSIEPLSWDVAPLLKAYLTTSPHLVQWLVIGAASDGPRYHQPNQWHLNDLLEVAYKFDVPVFFKGNLDRKLVTHWREEFPHSDPLKNLAA